MRILLATTSIPPRGGGISSYNYELVKTFKDNHCFDLMTTEDVDSLPEYNKVISIPKHSFGGYKKYVSVINAVNAEHYDLIINSDSSFVSIAAPFLHSHIITISHTYNNMPAIEAGFNHQYVDKIVALSAAGKQFLDRYFHIKDKNKVCYIYNFVHNESDSLLESKLHRDTIIIVYPGGASMMKHPEMVLLAVNKLLKTSLRFKFFWLGNPTLPLKEFSLAKHLNELLNDDPRLVFTGHISREEARRIIESSNVFLLPSRAEGCPMALIEALSTGCVPVVGSARHVCREILEDGHFGVVVKQGSSKDLFDNLVDIISNHENYLDNYDKTFHYSREYLSERVWVSKMKQVMEDSLKSQKELKKNNKVNLYLSLIRFRFHYYKMLFKDRMLSIWGLIEFNCIYLVRKVGVLS